MTTDCWILCFFPKKGGSTMPHPFRMTAWIKVAKHINSRHAKRKNGTTEYQPFPISLSKYVRLPKAERRFFVPDWLSKSVQNLKLFVYLYVLVDLLFAGKCDDILLLYGCYPSFACLQWAVVICIVITNNVRKQNAIQYLSIRTHNKLPLPSCM